jgi:hypothetical protein
VALLCRLQAGSRLPCGLRGEHVCDALRDASEPYPGGANLLIRLIEDMLMPPELFQERLGRHATASECMTSSRRRPELVSVSSAVQNDQSEHAKATTNEGSAQNRHRQLM